MNSSGHHDRRFESRSGGKHLDELETVHTLARVRRAMFGRGPGGLKVSRYFLEERLGSGGEGAVYAARDPELDRRVALKLLPSGSTTADADSRRLHEARTLASIRHPNVVTVHDVGEYEFDSDGTRGVFIVLELLEGDTLNAWLAHTPRTVGAIVDVMAQVGRGLRAVHAAGLVHRDVKPRNILVSDDGDAVLADFGVAEAVADQARDPLRSHDSGTPRYMAPEQRAGLPPDAKADQWSFCATLLTALTGCPPRLDTDEGPEANGHVVTAPQVPRRLRRLLRRGLSDDASRRFPSMDAVLARLDRGRVRHRRVLVAAVGGLALLGLVVASRAPRCADPATLVREAWEPGRAEQLEAALARAGANHAATTRAAMEGYARKWVDARRQSCGQSRAQDEASRRAAAATMSCLDHRLLSFRAAGDVLMDADATIAHGSDHILRRLKSPESCLDNPPRRARPTEPTNREVAALLMRATALVSMAKIERALATVESIDPSTLAGSQVGQWHGLRASILLRQGNNDRAEQGFNMALQHAEAAGNDEAAVRILIDLAHTISEGGSRYDEAHRLLAQARARAHAANLGSDVRASVALTAANLAFAEGDDGGALAQLDALHELCADEACGPHGARLKAAARLTGGNLLLARGDFDAARGELEAHLRVVERERSLHDQAWLSMHNLAIVCLQTGRLLEARSWFRAAARAGSSKEWRFDYGLARVAARMDDPETMDAHLRAAQIKLATYNHRSQWLLALEVTRASLERLRGDTRAAHERLSWVRAEHVRQFGEQDRRAVDVLEELAETQDALGNFGTCLTQHTTVLHWRQRELAPTHPLTARSQHGIGRCLLGLGRATEALDRFNLAREQWAAVGPATPWQLRVDHDLGRAYLALGQDDTAQRVLRRTLARLADSEAPHKDRATLLLSLARAHASGDVSVAKALAVQAHGIYQRLGERYRSQSLRVETWIAAL